MRVAIDGAGRVVVPKALRDMLGLQAGDALQIEVHEGRIEMQPVPNDMELAEEGGQPVLRSARPMPTLRAEDVRSILEQGRR